ncbi:MAG TPA: baseplate J/gp47 family protein [Ktedonobacteraceae bacterium]|nr:baseplate J/gp47 family protein [Ktedonobacteraceae bacterium]
MADEQIIYLSPEEELTNVRERLERIPTRRIILVVPTQTQLRSHVSWRLLYARARELNKEVLVISSDRQIRSVVKAVGFKVADSLESPPSSRPRPGSRPGRTSLGGKTSARLRTPPGRSLPNQQTATPRVKQPSEQPTQQYFNQPAMQQEVDERRPLEGTRDDVDRENEGQLPLESPPPASATFGMDDKQFAPGFDYRIGSSASIRPVIPPYSPPIEDEEPNLELEDYHQSQSIRQAAQQSDADTTVPMPDKDTPLQAKPQIFDLPSHHEADGPFTYLEDAQSVPLPEQRASVSMDEITDKVPDLADYPTPIDGIHIEDQGDLGDIVDLSDSSSSSWTMPAPDEEQDIQGPSRVHGIRPRTNRTGKVLPPVPPQSPQSPLPPPDSDDMELPPVYDQQEQLSPPPPTARPSGSLVGEHVKQTPSTIGTGNRPPQPVALPQPQSRTQPKPRAGQSLLKKRPSSNRAAAGAIPRFRRQPAAAQPQRARKRASSGRMVAPLLVILTLLIVVLLAFLVPSADVSVTLSSQNYPLQMTLTATATSRQDVVHQTLPAHTLVFDTTVTGLGHATGSTTVGTKAATGNVVFTNTGTTPIIIPTGTIVSTKNGVPFVTQAEPEVLPGNPLVTPIQAQNPGANGNVPANSIITIPSDSQTRILQANPGITKLALSVTNTDPTTGGGASSATSVTSNDVNAERTTLDSQVQAQVKDFLKKNVHQGDPSDQQGTPIQVETPIAAPAVGQVATDGTFRETLKLHMTVLVVRAADLQAAAAAQLKDTLNRQRSGLALVPQQPVQLKQLKNQPAKDGHALVLKLTAVGQVAAQISEDAVRNLVSGKPLDAAQHTLVGTNGIPQARDSQITVYPGFFHWMPFWSQRIHVHFKTLPVQPVPKPKKTK